MIRGSAHMSDRQVLARFAAQFLIGLPAAVLLLAPCVIR